MGWGDWTRPIAVTTSVLISLFLVYQINTAGLNNIAFEINTTQQENYRKAVVLENLLSLDADKDAFKDSDSLSSIKKMDDQRAVIPLEYFTNPLDSGDKYPDLDSAGVGYRKKDKHCYIPQVNGLDGENFGYYLLDIQSSGPQYFPPSCQKPQGKNAFSSPVLLSQAATGEKPIAARVYIYEIK
ncbi:MAG: hypothetical protein ABEJ95_03960 [Candidatus Nanohalobium sp.]